MKFLYVFFSLIFFSSLVMANQTNSKDIDSSDSLRWKGFNLGINSGLLINQTKGTLSPDGDLGPSPGRNDSWNYKNLGFTAGGQLGYKYQANLFVCGLETDFNYSYLKKNHFSARTVPSDPGGGSDISNDISHHMNWFGTFRPCLGLGFDTSFIYVTGGLAYGHVKSATEIIYRADPYIGSKNKTKLGWTIGGGLEYGFLKNWSFKLEYLFIDLGSLRYKVSDTTGFYPTYYFYTKLINKTSAVRLGLNWMF